MMYHQEDVPECPLCMEAFELDDINFLPCTCGYQICRFCWHRIRTNETGLCPACRKSYPEDPVHFKPLSEDEVHNIKRDRRQKEMSRRQKSSENRKHLTNVRVVQRNLVFVVGLSQRLADADILKRQEYFGKFGRIHKVVVNQSTSYVGSQGPSASAYVTYVRPEDAYHAILAVNNLHIDHRNLKASLGTTKYCSQFLKGTLCSKADCMYLHDLGDEAASFSKEDIQQGKHLQYEQKLIKQYSSSVQAQHKLSSDCKSPLGDDDVVDGIPDNDYSSLENNNNNYSALENNNYATIDNKSYPNTDNNYTSLENNTNYNKNDNNNSDNNNNKHASTSESSDNSNTTEDSNNNNSSSYNNDPGDDAGGGGGLEASKEDIKEVVVESTKEVSKGDEALEASDNNTLNEDLGFDPWDISSRGLADLIETEKISSTFDQALHLGEQHLHNDLFNLFLSQHPANTTAPRAPNYFRDMAAGDLYKASSGSFNPLSQHEHINLESRDVRSSLVTTTSPTFPAIPAPSNRWHPHHNVSWIQLHNSNALPNNTDFYASNLAQNITADPAIITAGILSEGDDSGFSHSFLNFNQKISARHHHLRLNNQLHTPFSEEHHHHSRLPPPGFPTTPSAEQHQLPAL